MSVVKHAYAWVAVLVASVVTATYLVAVAVHAPWLDDPRDYLPEAGPSVALLGVGFLAADVLLPVPSSGVMIALGAAFGVVAGAALSLLGGVAATLLAFALGRRGHRLVDRATTREQRERAGDLLSRYGLWAIVVTRPIPVVAETVGVLAGTAGALPWWQVALAGALGNVVPAVAYAELGAHAAGHGQGVAVVAGVMLLAVAAWAVQRHQGRRREA